MFTTAFTFMNEVISWYLNDGCFLLVSKPCLLYTNCTKHKIWFIWIRSDSCNFLKFCIYTFNIGTRERERIFMWFKVVCHWIDINIWWVVKSLNFKIHINEISQKFIKMILWFASHILTNFFINILICHMKNRTWLISYQERPFQKLEYKQYMTIYYTHEIWTLENGTKPIMNMKPQNFDHFNVINVIKLNYNWEKKVEILFVITKNIDKTIHIMQKISKWFHHV